MRIAHRFGDHDLQGKIETSFATAALDDGDVADARRHVRNAAAHLRRGADRAAAALVGVVSGRIALVAGQEIEGIAHLRDAADVLHRLGRTRWRAQTLVTLSAGLAAVGRFRDAERALAEATALNETIADRMLDEQLALHEAIVAVYRGRLAANARGGGAVLVSDRKALEIVHRYDGSNAVAQSESVRLALFLLQRCVSSTAQPPGQSEGYVGQSEGWVLAEDGSGFATPTGLIVELDRRRAMRRILAALIKQRRHHSGEVLSREVLIRCGWPDEQIVPDAAINRLNFALVTLRRSGLRGLLETVGLGYRLNPSELVTYVQARDDLDAQPPSHTKRR